MFTYLIVYWTVMTTSNLQGSQDTFNCRRFEATSQKAVCYSSPAPSVWITSNREGWHFLTAVAISDLQRWRRFHRWIRFDIFCSLQRLIQGMIVEFYLVEHNLNPRRLSCLLCLSTLSKWALGSGLLACRVSHLSKANSTKIVVQRFTCRRSSGTNQ